MDLHAAKFLHALWKKVGLAWPDSRSKTSEDPVSLTSENKPSPTSWESKTIVPVEGLKLDTIEEADWAPSEGMDRVAPEAAHTGSINGTRRASSRGSNGIDTKADGIVDVEVRQGIGEGGEGAGSKRTRMVSPLRGRSGSPGKEQARPSSRDQRGSPLSDMSNHSSNGRRGSSSSERRTSLASRRTGSSSTDRSGPMLSGRTESSFPERRGVISSERSHSMPSLRSESSLTGRSWSSSTERGGCSSTEKRRCLTGGGQARSTSKSWRAPNCCGCGIWRPRVKD
jgi:hypothetical protein